MAEQCITVVAKDVGQTKIALPIVQELHAQGEALEVYADGPAVGILEKNQIPFRTASQYYTSWNSGDTTTIVAGLSSDPALEYNLLLNGLDANIPTIMLVDVPGMHRRHPVDENPLAEVSLYLVADPACKKEVLKDFPGANVEIIGNASIGPVCVSTDVVTALATIRKEQDLDAIVTIAARNTISDIEIAIETAASLGKVGVCLGMHPDPSPLKQPPADAQIELYRRMFDKHPGLLLIFGTINPERYKDDPEKFASATMMLEFVSQAEDEGRAVTKVPGGSIPWALRSDFCFTSYSGVGFTSADHGILTIAVTTPEVQEGMKTDFPGVSENLLVTAKAALGITEAIDLTQAHDFPDLASFRWGGNMPFSAKEAAKHILAQ